MPSAEGADDLFCTVRAGGQRCDESDLSSFGTPRTDSLAVKQALKSETVLESIEILTKGRGRRAGGGGGGGGEVSISSLHCWNSSAPVKTAALSRQ